MAAVAVAGNERVCVGCGAVFVDRSRTAPRSYCYVCRPSGAARVEAPAVAPVPGDPFTVEHFERWAYELTLDTGDRWRVDPFFLAFVEDLFAGIPECWLVVPEANTKTTGTAGVALYHCEHTPYGWAAWAASARDQAEIGYIQAEGFIERTPRLQPLFKCHPGYRRIRSRVNGARLQIFAADDRTGDGIIPTLGLLDELHRHRDLRLYRTWRGKIAKRGGQIAALSTAGEPGSEFEETRERIRQSAEDLRIEGSFTRAVSGGVVLHDWAVPEDGDVEDMGVVKAANPFSGITVEALREKRNSPTMTLSHWRRFVCNLPTREVEVAVQEAEWYAARVDDGIPAGEPIWLGLDLGWKYDTTALVPFWMPRPDFRLFGPASILVPPRDGGMLDARLVEQALLETHERNPIHTVVMDPTKGEQLAQWIESELGCEVVEHQQSLSLQVLDYLRFMEALREGWLHHTGDPGLSRHVLNAVAKMLPRGDVVFERPRQSRTVSRDHDRRVIDALMAAAMVHCIATAAQGPPDLEPMVAFA